MTPRDLNRDFSFGFAYDLFRLVISSMNHDQRGLPESTAKKDHDEPRVAPIPTPQRQPSIRSRADRATRSSQPIQAPHNQYDR